ncbi:hypothetical protein CIK05_00115 [Bdellovibrio sp. qaytius]|nr:hypothetical protein CIK05_00115 [Bdellovibrio sp. qaytius]
MKKASDLMKEMGFNKDAPVATQEAFIKHLIKAATGNSVVTPTEKKIIQENPDKIVQFPKQLAFDFADEELLSPAKKIKKA